MYTFSIWLHDGVNKMRYRKSSYYSLLHERNYDQVVENAQFEVISILNGFALGEFQEDDRIYDIFLHAIVFIETFLAEVSETGPKWSNELARKKLSIVLWWHKTLMLDNKEIHSIYSVFEGCTDCPRTLERLLNLPTNTVEDALDHVVVESEPCEICGCVKYTITSYICYDCAKSGDVVRQSLAVNRKVIGKVTRARREREGYAPAITQSKRDRIYAKWVMRLSAERERRRAYQKAQEALQQL
ncbi:hypothetical protein F3W96_19765 [Salmonella enterica]|nr:hypothetical protein [Salmonella enterica subsp. enterica serovar Sandiego]